MYLCLNTLYYHHGDTIMVSDYLLDPDRLGELIYKDLNISTFYAIKNGPHGLESMIDYDHDDTQRYISINYFQVFYNESLGWDLHDRISEKKLKGKVCTKDDFNYMSDFIIKSWTPPDEDEGNHLKIICPDI